MTAAVIVNLRSSRAGRDLDRIRAMLATANIDVTNFWAVESNVELKRRLKQAVRQGIGTAIVGGGDGTMTQAANVLAHTKTALGVLPLGTGNSFSLTLGIGNDLEKAIEVIAAGRVACVDLGVVNGRYFANFATIGFAAEVAESTDHNLKALVGPLAYFAAAVRPLFTHRGFRAQVRAKKVRLTFETQQIVVVNGRFFGNRAITSDANDTDGRLRFYATSGGSGADALKTYAAFALGVHQHLPDAHAFRSKKIEIRARPKQALNIDGDPLGKTPARFSVARRALRVFVPHDFAAGDD